MPAIVRPARRSPALAASLAEQAYTKLRRAVINGTLAGGQDISEPELADQLGMSKTPVREALARLVVEGLVGAFPRRGYRVTPVTVSAINDLFTVRAALEGAAASLAAMRVTAEELARLEALAGDARPDGAQGIFAANRAFHLALVEAAGSPRLLALVRSHLEEGERYFHLGARQRALAVSSSPEHALIVATLRAGNAALARQEMEAHVDRTRQGLLRALLDTAQRGITF